MGDPRLQRSGHYRALTTLHSRPCTHYLALTTLHSLPRTLALSTLHSANILSTDLAHVGHTGQPDWQHGSQALYSSPHLLRHSWQVSVSATDFAATGGFGVM